MEERRKAARVKLDLTINYGLKSSVYLKNLSSAGINFTSAEKFKQKDFIVLTFSLDEHREIKVIGKVVRVREISTAEIEYGLEFWNIEEADREYIDQFVRSQIKETSAVAATEGNP